MVYVVHAKQKEGVYCIQKEFSLEYYDVRPDERYDLREDWQVLSKIAT
jgi:hypothetical protein